RRPEPTGRSVRTRRPPTSHAVRWGARLSTRAATPATTDAEAHVPTKRSVPLAGRSPRGEAGERGPIVLRPSPVGGQPVASRSRPSPGALVGARVAASVLAPTPRTPGFRAGNPTGPPPLPAAATQTRPRPPRPAATTRPNASTSSGVGVRVPAIKSTSPC